MEVQRIIRVGIAYLNFHETNKNNNKTMTGIMQKEKDDEVEIVI